MRIWVVYVAQGDGVLIELPERYSYRVDGAARRLEVMIDGGAAPAAQRHRFADFLERLRPGEDVSIEHAVISHHDADHVRGLTWLLDETEIGIDAIYHNGLASYRRGTTFDGAVGFPAAGRPQDAIYTSSGGRVSRGMAFLDADGVHLQAAYLVESLAALRAASERGVLHGAYDDLAAAVVGRRDPQPVREFRRAHAGADFIAEVEAASGRGVDLSGLSFGVLWPLARLRHYGRDWGETINGNSITFRLRYGDFEMLFCGDHNEKSEQALLEHLRAGAGEDRLRCDVLKVPHHGSSHAYEPFYRACAPVVAVASMGEQGFRSKRLDGRNWQHPAEEVIRWLGGSHRVYHTLIHERRFRWRDLDSYAKHQALTEFSHVLIETDGTWFRVVEVPDLQADPNAAPTVAQTRRGNGTRWIRTR